MITLEPDECRVLGVLVEKAQTTPQQYPLTLNSLVTGCNQKNNRDPLTNLDEDRVLAALDALRAKDLAQELMLSSSRVAKYRHNARAVLGIETGDLVILAELLLRGPQTVGELRGRATRMHTLDSIEVVEGLLKGLMGREPPMVRELPPAPGTRAARYAQVLCPALHPTDAPARAAGGPAHSETASAAASAALAARVDTLEAEVEALKQQVTHLSESLRESHVLDAGRH